MASFADVQVIPGGKECAIIQEYFARIIEGLEQDGILHQVASRMVPEHSSSYEDLVNFSLKFLKGSSVIQESF